MNEDYSEFHPTLVQTKVVETNLIAIDVVGLLGEIADELQKGNASFEEMKILLQRVGQKYGSCGPENEGKVKQAVIRKGVLLRSEVERLTKTSRTSALNIMHRISLNGDFRSVPGGGNSESFLLYLSSETLEAKSYKLIFELVKRGESRPLKDLSAELGCKTEDEFSKIVKLARRLFPHAFRLDAGAIERLR